MEKKKRNYMTIYLLNLKAIKDNTEYTMGLEFMDGYPRFVVRKYGESYPTVKVTFTVLSIMTFITAIDNVIQNGGNITIDSKNFKFVDNEKTDTLESVGMINVSKHESGAIVMNISHGDFNIDFPIILDRKFFNFYRNGAAIDNEMYKTTAKAYIELLKNTITYISNVMLLKAADERKKEKDAVEA